MQGWDVLEQSAVKVDPGSEQAQMGVVGEGRVSQLISVSTELTGTGDRSESQDWRK